MGKKEIIEIIQSNKPELELRYGVQLLGLFGSYVLRNNARKAIYIFSSNSTAT